MINCYGLKLSGAQVRIVIDAYIHNCTDDQLSKLSTKITNELFNTSNSLLRLEAVEKQIQRLLKLERKHAANIDVSNQL